MQSIRREENIRAIYSTLAQAWGPQHWWPAKTPFEVIVGAYLTQNTNWTNVELALAQLRAARVLSVAGIRNVPLRKLQKLIRSSGYFRQKAKRLKLFVKFLDDEYAGSLRRMFSQPTSKLREQLLALDGVGAETADSMLLYAGQHPIFVVDAYTRRVSERHGILPAKAGYDEVRIVFEKALRSEAPLMVSSPSTGGAWHLPSRMSLAPRTMLAQVFNEMHGLLVGVGKNYCLKSKIRCEACPLKSLLPAPQVTTDL